MPKRFLLLLTLSLIPLAACTGNGLRWRGGAAPAAIRVQLNREEGVNFAGYYQAEAQGFYAQHDLKVSLLPGGKRGELTIDPAQILLSGQSEFAVLSFAQYQRIAQDEHQPLVVMGLFQISPIVFLSFEEEGILRMQDIRDKRVAIPSADWRILIHQVLKNVGISANDISEVQLNTPDIQNFYQQRVDVWPGYLTEDAVDALMNGYRIHAIFAADYGLDTYEGLLVTTRGYADAHPEISAAFVEATLQGWRYVLAHPDETADLLVRVAPQHSRLYYQLGLEYLRPLIDTGEVPLGWIDYTRWNTFLDGASLGENAPGYDMRFVEGAYLQE